MPGRLSLILEEKALKSVIDDSEHRSSTIAHDMLKSIKSSNVCCGWCLFT